MVISPTKNAKLWKDQMLRSMQRNELLKTVNRLGRCLLEKGALPCAECSAFCEGCNGMKVDLKNYSDQTFWLERTSNIDHNKHELYEGNFSFLDNEKVKIQLQSVKERN